MFYLKLTDSKDLLITQKEAIYRNENLSGKMIFLIPMTVDEVDMLTATLYLNFIRADGGADIVELMRDNTKYNDTYYQYTLPINNKFTRYAGEVIMWLQIFEGPSSLPSVAKSGECVVYVQDSPNMDDYLSDQQITAIYQLKKRVDECGCSGGGGSGDDSGDETPDWEPMEPEIPEPGDTPDWEEM